MQKLVLFVFLVFALCASAQTLTTINSLDNDVSLFKSCQQCANSKGSTAFANYSLTNVTTPSRNGGVAALFSIQPVNPYANVYWYRQLITEHPGAQHAQKVALGFWMLTDENLKSSQAIEFEIQTRDAGYRYNFSWQMNWRAGIFKNYDVVLRKWTPTTCKTAALLTPGWHHVWVSGTRTATGIIDDFVNIDGVVCNVGAAHPRQYDGARDQFNVAFQLDSNGVPVPYSIALDSLNVNYR